MSNWTHIVGALYIETGELHKDIKKYVKKQLKDAPKIRGSERDVDIFINELSGYNVWTSKGEYQSCVCISIIGDLRDADMQSTEKELNDFIYFIKTKFYIRDSSIKIYEEWSGKEKHFKEGWFNDK